MWGVNSSARLPAHGGVFPEDATRQAGYRMPSVEAPKTSLHSGARVAIVGHGAPASAPGEARGETGAFVGTSRAALEGFPVKNAAALRGTFESQFGACSERPGRPRPSGLEYDGVRGIVCARVRFARWSPRVAHRRPRASLFAEDYPKCALDPAR